nr:MAG TPA: hypothetical protein [Caudoviricetes sp.]
MKVKYKGPNMGATGPQNDGVYEVTKVYRTNGKWALALIDENADGEAYQYSATAPTLNGGPGITYAEGRFYIVEDENGRLAQAGVLPLID